MRDIRAKGIPQFGAGLIFPVDEKSLLVEPLKRPSHWVRLGSCDFGWSHKAAFCELWHDRDRDRGLTMYWNLAIAAIVGWCGTGWPIRFPIGGGKGGGGDDPWPPNCWVVCGQIIGAISAVILVYLVERTITGSGLVGLVTVSFFAGSFGSNLVGSLFRMSRG